MRASIFFFFAEGLTMPLSRRRFIEIGVQAAALLSPAAQALAQMKKAAGAQFKIGAPDWSLKQEAKLEAIAMAKKIGVDGVQISLGHEGVTTANDHLPLAKPETQKAYLAESKRVGLPLTSVCAEILHRNYLKSDPLGQRWVAESIPAAKALGVRVILLPFFGNGALKTTAEMDYVGDALREIAPAAEKAGVVLGLEDTISAKDNVRIMERSKSPAVLTYYDVGNSTGNGFDVISEIKWLGRDRICEVHLKDNPHYLGEGTIDFAAVVKTLADIGYSGWAQLETSAPSGNIEADMSRNLAFIRDKMRQVTATA
jgi:L-ribulose-5-phosphate 3-epimerase